MALNHGSTALELPYLHTQPCYRTVSSKASYGSGHCVKHARTPWLRHFGTSSLSTIAFTIAWEPERPLTTAPWLQICHICTHDFAAARPVPTHPTSPRTKSSTPMHHG